MLTYLLTDGQTSLISLWCTGIFLQHDGFCINYSSFTYDDQLAWSSK